MLDLIIPFVVGFIWGWIARSSTTFRDKNTDYDCFAEAIEIVLAQKYQYIKRKV